MAVVYMNVEKLKRGYYLASFELITDKPKKYKVRDDIKRLLDEINKIKNF